VKNTVEEFLCAVLHDDLGGATQETISNHVMHVPDSTIPQRVEGAENIVFEGRLDTWTGFSEHEDAFDEAGTNEALALLKQALTRLGTLVTGYDRAPRSDSVALEMEELASSSGTDGMRVPLLL
jgi:hypothetical protein